MSCMQHQRCRSLSVTTASKTEPFTTQTSSWHRLPAREYETRPDALRQLPLNPQDALHLKRDVPDDRLIDHVRL